MVLVMNMVRLRVINLFDPWKSPLCTCPTKWVIHPYTGCSHHCLYCYATSYIPKHDVVRVKTDFLNKLQKDLAKMPKGAIIEMSSSSDPYPPIEAYNCLTRNTLYLLLTNEFKVLIITKSSLILRDLDILSKYKNRVVVAITITTIRDSIATDLEPQAPFPSERLKAVEILARSGINVVVRVDPIIPYINDDYNDLKALIKEISKRGAKQITSSTYKAKGDSLRRISTKFYQFSKKLFDLYSRDKAEYIHGYRYLNRNLRFSYMKMVKELAEEEGLVFGTCREGFFSLNTPGFSCDGSTYFYI